MEDFQPFMNVFRGHPALTTRSVVIDILTGDALLVSVYSNTSISLSKRPSSTDEEYISICINIWISINI